MNLGRLLLAFSFLMLSSLCSFAVSGTLSIFLKDGSKQILKFSYVKNRETIFFEYKDSSKSVKLSHAIQTHNLSDNVIIFDQDLMGDGSVNHTAFSLSGFESMQALIDSIEKEFLNSHAGSSQSIRCLSCEQIKNAAPQNSHVILGSSDLTPSQMHFLKLLEPKFP